MFVICSAYEHALKTLPRGYREGAPMSVVHEQDVKVVRKDVNLTVLRGRQDASSGSEVEGPRRSNQYPLF
jgi:hypothetical protein